MSHPNAFAAKLEKESKEFNDKLENSAKQINEKLKTDPPKIKFQRSGCPICGKTDWCACGYGPEHDLEP